VPLDKVEVALAHTSLPTRFHSQAVDGDRVGGAGRLRSGDNAIASLAGHRHDDAGIAVREAQPADLSFEAGRVS